MNDLTKSSCVQTRVVRARCRYAKQHNEQAFRFESCAELVKATSPCDSGLHRSTTRLTGLLPTQAKAEGGDFPKPSYWVLPEPRTKVANCAELGGYAHDAPISRPCRTRKSTQRILGVQERRWAAMNRFAESAHERGWRNDRKAAMTVIGASLSVCSMGLPDDRNPPATAATIVETTRNPQFIPKGVTDTDSLCRELVFPAVVLVCPKVGYDSAQQQHFQSITNNQG